MAIASHIVMIRPASFSFNEETAASNVFQQRLPEDKDEFALLMNAQSEFDNMVTSLRHWGVTVRVFNDTREPRTPDAVYPNNWFSMHSDGRIYIYPMMSPTRRLERRQDILDDLAYSYDIKEVVDLHESEDDELYLEGTGSMILDRDNRTAYCCLSPRTSEEALEVFAKKSGYKTVIFTATDEDGVEIYHTNVMLGIGDTFAVVCLESVKKASERATLREALIESGREIIDISREQMGNFCANVMQLTNWNEVKFIVLSQRAWKALTPDQQKSFHRHGTPLWLPLDTIELLGGSARCMIAENFLPSRVHSVDPDKP